jgi:hypothetical protein
VIGAQGGANSQALGETWNVQTTAPIISALS